MIWAAAGRRAMNFHEKPERHEKMDGEIGCGFLESVSRVDLLSE